jgi:hypothetical protein
MKLQASTINRCKECPGSLYLDTVTPDNMKYRPFENLADFGKRVHTAAETYLELRNQGKRPKIDNILIDLAFVPESDEWARAAHAATWYAEYILRVKAERKMIAQPELIIEEKFRIIEEGAEYVAKADSMLITETDGVLYVDIFDLKTGNFDYSGSAFSQLKFGLSVFIAAKYAKSEKRVIGALHIVQPNYYDETYRAVKEDMAHASPGEIIRDLDELSEYIKTHADTFNQGDHCTMCPVVHQCPVLNSMHALVETASRKDAFDLMTVSKEKLEFIWLHKKQLETFLKAVEQAIKDRIGRGQMFESIGLNQKYGNRKWVSKDDVIDRFEPEFGDKIYEPKKLKSPAQLEKLVGKENLKGYVEKPVSYVLGELKNPFDAIK